VGKVREVTAVGPHLHRRARESGVERCLRARREFGAEYQETGQADRSNAAHRRCDRGLQLLRRRGEKFLPVAADQLTSMMSGFSRPAS
jgi:hypothetical protein